MANPNQVTVKITANSQQGITTIKIELDKDPFYLGGQGTGNPGVGAPIQWVIDNTAASGWTFDGGIAIANPSGKFSDDGTSPNKMSHSWHRLSADNNSYKYSISVANATTRVIVDPSIINQP